MDFEDMKRIRLNPSNITISSQIKDMSNTVIDSIFQNTSNYKIGSIYDASMNLIQQIDFKFIKAKTYTVDKDQVEFYVQFRPHVIPEVMFDKSYDQRHRFGYYLDIQDDNSGITEKWIILGKDAGNFDRYLILKCNWTFEWIDKNRKYHKCLGVLRDRNNYNSGVWSDGFTTSVENQTSFFVPTNDETRTISYDSRFMITDNPTEPKTYYTTKIMDTFPLGITKIILSQSHYNKFTDYHSVKKEQIFSLGDTEPMIHMICDYNKSSLSPLSDNAYSDKIIDEVEKIVEEPETLYNEITWSIDKSNYHNVLYVNGSPQTLFAKPNYPTTTYALWKIYIDNEDYSNQLVMLKDYMILKTDYENNSLSIKIINENLVGHIIKIIVYNSSNEDDFDFVEMEIRE